MSKLDATYGPGIPYASLLYGYFGSGYMGCEAAEEIDWVWGHCLEDLALSWV